LEPSGEDAEGHLIRLRAELDTWLAPHDAFDVIGSLALAAYLVRVDDVGRHPQLESYVVEYGAVHLLRRGGRARLDDADAKVDWDGGIEDLSFLLNRTLMISRGVEGRRSTGEELSEAEVHAQQRYMTMQLFGHDPVPPERELERLQELFLPFEEILYEQLGFTAIMAAALCTSISVATGEGLAAYFELDVSDPLEVRAELQRRALERHPARYGLAVHQGLGSALALSAEELGGMIGFPAEIATNLLGRLEIGFGDMRDGDPWQQVRRFRRTPVIADGSGGWLVPVPYDVLYVVRGLLEDALREAGLLEEFQRRRAEYLERVTRETFAVALTPELNLRSLSYEHPVEGEVRLPEGDGLVVSDGVALALEAKAGGLSPAARGGEPKALAKAFNRLLFEAIEQAERTRGALVAGRVVNGVDEETKTVEVNPANLSRVVPVAVTLEDLSGPSAMLWELMDREPEAVDPSDWPWIVNVDDLRWFAEELPLAAELIHYVLVRQRLASAGEISVGNEADWFRFYRNQGAAQAQAIVDGAAEGDFNRRILVVSDARRGRFDPDLAPIELAVTPILKRLDVDRRPGWLDASIALLDLHPEQGREALGDLERRLQRAENGYVATATVLPAADPRTALTIRIGSLELGPHERDGELVEPEAERRVLLALDGTPQRPQFACRVEQTGIVP